MALAGIHMALMVAFLFIFLFRLSFSDYSFLVLAIIFKNFSINGIHPGCARNCIALV